MSPVKIIFILWSVVLWEFASSQSKVIDSLQQIVAQGKNDVENIRALNNIATEYTRSDMMRAKSYLYRSILLSTQINNQPLLGYAYAQMISIQTNTGKKDSAAYYLQLLKNISGDNASQKARNNFNSAAGLFYKQTGNFKEALPYMSGLLDNYLLQEKTDSSVGLKTSIAGQCLNIGNLYVDLGNYKNALQYHLKALQRFEAIDNKRGISFCNQSISSDFLDLNQYKQAAMYVSRAIALKTELNDKRGIAIATGQYGEIYKGLGNYDSALYYFTDASKTFHDMKLVPDEGKMDIELGKLFMLRKDSLQASRYFEVAKHIALQLKDSSMLTAADAEIVVMQNKLAREKRAEQKLTANLQNSIETGDKGKEVMSYKYLAEYYAGKKQFDKALEYTDKWHNTNDSIQSNDLQVQVKKIEQQFNAEKNEKEIALLKKDQQLNLLSLQRQRWFQYGALVFLALLAIIGLLVINRYRAVQKVNRAMDIEKMRNNIARDLHDDIGSTLTSINILSNVTLQHQAGTDPLMVANMQKIKNRSSAIMESMSDIIWAINPQNDTIGQMLSRMKEFTAEILEPLNINYNFKEEGDFFTVKLDIKKRKDFYLLFKEAINNAAKYSRCTNLCVQIAQSHSMLHLTVADDGVGFNEAVVKNGNGLTNMKQRAAAMGGAFKMVAVPGEGTSIALDVPVT